MSDLVGNPEDRFSQNEAHYKTSLMIMSNSSLVKTFAATELLITNINSNLFVC